MRIFPCQVCGGDIEAADRGRRPLYHPGECKKKACAAGMRAWRAANPDVWKVIRFKAQIKHRYGLTLEEHAALIAEGCWICGTHEDLAIDHCHSSGDVRSALCRTHNTGLGAFQDDPEMLRRAIAYLQHHGTPAPSHLSVAA